QRAPLGADEAPEEFEPGGPDLDEALRRHSPTRIRLAQVVTLVIVLATLGGLLLHNGAFTVNRPQPTTAIAPTRTPNINGPIVTPALIVSLSVLFEYLPDASQAGALAAATAALQSVTPQISVPAGEYYATGLDANGNIISQRATAPLQAELLAASAGFDYY